MANRQFRTVLEGGSYFEGPRWHDGEWWVSDFYRRTVSRVSQEGREKVVLEVEHQPSGLGWLPDGSLIVTSMKDHRLLRVTDGEVSTHARLTEYCGGHLNDLVVSAQGHVFVGDLAFDLMGGGTPAPTSLKRVDPDGTVTVVAEDMRTPNGMAITPDGGTLLVDETLGNRVTAFDLAPDGSVSNRRVWAEFGPEPTGSTIADVIGAIDVAPDGCSLDADGHLWVADGKNPRVVRVAEGGAIVEEIAMPDGLGVFACQLGGDDGRTLLLCAAPDFFEHTRAPVREAVLLAVDVEVPHAGLP
ncbi:gluconolactonase [Blastococcus sp. CT_GayMR20]|uniref:SMP-30/gluconolactonase/LRE family protein n=1 Tax=Blastococcus sp. CT_GayMR20 TaxID=2559609 RepID=UPI001074782E|nr:SMP-30/gluconolactonase/LRE family protein [Blastococcus sp. CT_GayMR20]TFV86716.1 gluconolactonase [Blastococcus sp. CT_GayMR20]